MPRVKKFIPIKQEQLALQLRETYGGGMSQSDVCSELGIKNHETCRAWLSGVEFLRVGHRKYYRTDDVAAKIYRETVSE